MELKTLPCQCSLPFDLIIGKKEGINNFPETTTERLNNNCTLLENYTFSYLQTLTIITKTNPKTLMKNYTLLSISIIFLLAACIFPSIPLHDYATFASGVSLWLTSTTSIDGHGVSGSHQNWITLLAMAMPVIVSLTASALVYKNTTDKRRISQHKPIMAK